jgi:hypothetical protein
MAIDWSAPEFAFLKRQLALGRVCLFAGAGFSLGARNKLGEPLPLGGTLANILATEAGEDYAGETLPTVYEAVETTIGTNRLWEILQERYTTTAVDDWYSLAMSITWHRVYTTNIDDLFEFLTPYASGQKPKFIVRRDPIEERDPHFDRLHCVHLHGHKDHRAAGLTFTPMDFATHTAQHDPWYQSLVDDIHNAPVIFIGTQLEEPILNHYLEIREARPNDRDAKEWRPKSYYVNRTISSLKQKSLEARNIVSIECTGEEFFRSLADNITLTDLRVPQVRAAAFPHLFGTRKVQESVAGHFDPIVPGQLPKVRPDLQSRFFLGAEPTWDDIDKRRDGDRQITTALLDKAKEASDKFRLIVLHGPAGSGKTTTMMRVAHELAAVGKQVYFARGTHRISWDGMLQLIENQRNAKESVYVFVDVISRHIVPIVDATRALQDSTNLTLIVGDRTNAYVSKCLKLTLFDPVEIPMPDLAEPDVNSILDRLDKFGFLGVLKNKNRDQQVEAFMSHANRQLLVAMKEATSGKDFDLILKDEFHELVTEAQIAYLICSLAVAHGAPGVYRKHLAPCLPKSSFAKGLIIEDLLRGVLVPANYTGTMIKPRHRLIAQWIANQVAPLEMRHTAIVSFLKQVASSIVPNEIRRRSAPYLAYRGMVNSEALYETFGGHAKAVLDVYEEVRAYYSNDFLFWLQFGMAEIRAGNLDVGENYLNQSLAIYPRSFQTQHQLGILYLIQAQASENPAAMQTKAEEGMELLSDQIHSRGDEDSYPYHAYLTHVTRWYEKAGDLITQEQWEVLRKIGSEAKAKYRLDDGILAAQKNVEFIYMRRGLGRGPTSPGEEGATAEPPTE